MSTNESKDTGPYETITTIGRIMDRPRREQFDTVAAYNEAVVNHFEISKFWDLYCLQCNEFYRRDDVYYHHCGEVGIPLRVAIDRESHVVDSKTSEVNL